MLDHWAASFPFSSLLTCNNDPSTISHRQQKSTAEIPQAASREPDRPAGVRRAAPLASTANENSPLQRERNAKGAGPKPQSFPPFVAFCFLFHDRALPPSAGVIFARSPWNFVVLLGYHFNLTLVAGCIYFTFYISRLKKKQPNRISFTTAPGNRAKEANREQDSLPAYSCRFSPLDDF